jgi:hypothetical protein
VFGIGRWVRFVNLVFGVRLWRGIGYSVLGIGLSLGSFCSFSTGGLSRPYRTHWDPPFFPGRWPGLSKVGLSGLIGGRRLGSFWTGIGHWALGSFC